MRDIIESRGSSDYKVTLKVQNGYLAGLMEFRGVKNASELSRLCGVCQTTVGKILNLQFGAYDKRGDVKPSVKKIADFFECSVEDIYPPDHIVHPLEQTSFTAYMSAAELPDAAFIGCPSEAIEQSDDITALLGGLSRIEPRLKDVLTMRFGLENGTPMTLDAIANTLGLSRERVRQLEKKARRRLLDLAGAGEPAAIRRSRGHWCDVVLGSIGPDPKAPGGLAG